MSVLNSKDGNGMENVRLFTGSDEVFYSTMNRPLEDLEQRTDDLNKILAPDRGLHVHQTYPPSKYITIEPGVYMSGNTLPTVFPDVGFTTDLLIPDAGAGNFRIDLIVLNLLTGEPSRLTGSAEANWVNAWTNRATLDSVSGNNFIPLAYLYVGQIAADVYSDIIVVDNPGHIRDARLSHGAARHLYEDTFGNLLGDTLPASVGTSTREARADHQHPVNVGATLPSAINLNSVASVGAALLYSRKDHIHGLTTEAVAANLQEDGPSGAGEVGVAGTSVNFVRADHQHPLNVTATLPLTADLTQASAIGVATTYSRRDHVHKVEESSLVFEQISFSWVLSNALTTVIPTITPKWAFFTASGYYSANPNYWLMSSGCVDGDNNEILVCSHLDWNGPAAVVSSFAIDTSANNMNLTGWGDSVGTGLGFAYDFIAGSLRVVMSLFDVAGITLTPSAAWSGKIYMTLVGQE